MRRLVYLLSIPFILIAGQTNAQTFSFSKDTVTATAYAYIDIYNNVTNLTSSAITINWKVINETLPQSWEDNVGFGLCDNITCYDKGIFSGSTQTMDTISGGAQSLFKVQLDVSPSAVTPATTPVYVSVELTDGTTTDTVTFAIHKWGTNINKVSANNEDINVYPNPAYGDVNVTFSKDMGIRNIAIYNLVGKQISNYRVSTNSAKLDLGKVPAGIYFLRLVDGNGRTVATRRFTHQ